MKPIIVLFSVIILGITAVNGQSFIGMNQSKILKNLGQPDEKGSNYFTYYNPTEGGVDTYYFDSEKNCNAFVITRGESCFEDYLKLLTRDFVRTPDNLYVCSSKNKNYKAEITTSNDEFQIRITSYQLSGLPVEKNVAGH